MWKFVTRGIRESLDRRLCRTNVYSQTNNNNSENNDSIINEQQLHQKNCLAKYHSDLKSPIFSDFARRHCQYLGAETNNEKQKSDPKYSWSDAVGWSGILAIGYTVCQSLFIRRSLFDVDNNNVEKWKKKLIVDSNVQTTQVLGHKLLPKPQYMLQVTNVNNKSIELTVNSSEDLVDGAVDIKETYGPITAEQALKEAVNDLSFANEGILGELEFNSGIIAIEEKRYEDAVQHFLSGSNFSSVRSMFNLGLCYELGLGTEKNLEKAIKYFKKAANKGHVDAMYNVGVYFSQGKGGVPVDIKIAKHWFEEAAFNGQLDAIKALKLEEIHKKQKTTSLEQKLKNHIKDKTMKSIKTNVLTKLVDYKNKIKNSLDTQTESDDSSYYDDNLNSPNPTELFMEMLGVNQQSVNTSFMANNVGKSF